MNKPCSPEYERDPVTGAGGCDDGDCLACWAHTCDPYAERGTALELSVLAAPLYREDS